MQKHACCLARPPCMPVKTGMGEAIAANWVSGGNPKARAGGHGHGHGPRFFFNDMPGISEEVYDVHNEGAYGASHPSLLEAGASSLAGNTRTAKAVAAVAHSSGPPTTPSPLSAMALTHTPVEKVCNRCANVCKCHDAQAPCINGCRRCGYATHGETRVMFSIDLFGGLASNARFRLPHRSSSSFAMVSPRVCERNVVVQPHTCTPCTCAISPHSWRRWTCQPPCFFAKSVALM